LDPILWGRPNRDGVSWGALHDKCSLPRITERTNGKKKQRHRGDTGLSQLETMKVGPAGETKQLQNHTNLKDQLKGRRGAKKLFLNGGEAILNVGKLERI